MASKERAMCKLSATTRDKRAKFFAMLIVFFTGSSQFAMAEQPTARQSSDSAPAGAMIGGAAAETITAEGELKATIRTFQGGNPSAVFRYYWWHDGCYVRYQSGNYQSVSAEYCHQPH